MGSPPRLRPGTAPQTLRTPPRDGRPVLRSSVVGAPQVHLGCVRLSPACPCRYLHTCHLRPARHYPRLWIRPPSSGGRRDFNPPDQCAAWRTVRAPPTPVAARPLRPVGRGKRPQQRVSRVAPSSFTACRLHYPGGQPDADGCRAADSSAFPAFRPGRRPRQSFGACSEFTHVTARRVAARLHRASVRRLQARRLPPVPAP